ncbi:MAG: aldehyde dehydrogenase family protein [Nitrososphaerales archaeon]
MTAEHLIEKKVPILEQFVDGRFRPSSSKELHDIFNPSKGTVLAKIPYATQEETNEAIENAAIAFETWKNVPITERVKYIFKLKECFERHFEELAIANSENHGKTIVESRGDIRRAIDNIDSAISVAYTLAKGENLDQIAEGIDEFLVKEPLGVFGIICPFNFPVMIPFWFIPYAIVLGDTLVVKPSEITPLPMDLVARLVSKEVGFPHGVLNIVYGGREVSQDLIKNKDVQGVAFVGSTPVAKEIYKLAGEYGKRSLVNGGAKNSIVVLPDAELGNSIPSIISSFFGNAGQRCLAGSNLVSIGKVHDEVLSKFKSAALSLKVGPALQKTTEMGPVVSKSAKQRITKDILEGQEEGGKMILDGTNATVTGYEEGYYLRPTILELDEGMKSVRKEIFGPVAGLLSFESLDDAINFINKSTFYGNMASIFTTNGRNAREFRRRVNAGNIGINIGVASAAANFPFGGRRDSFYGTLHAQIDTVDFFTDKKVIISKW